MSPIFMFGRFEATELTATVMRWNPITYLMECYRTVFVYHPEDWGGLVEQLSDAQRKKIPLIPASYESFPWLWLGLFALIAVVTLAIGYFVFMRSKMRFADEI